MLISIALIAALLCVAVLLLRPARRKQYNEFRRPAVTASGFTVYGDTGGAGISGGGMDGGCGGGGGGDGGGGGC
jgi:uncharacterized membrane protein YgcG